MRFILTLDQAISAAGIAFCLAVGWTVGVWLTNKFLGAIGAR